METVVKKKVKMRILMIVISCIILFLLLFNAFFILFWPMHGEFFTAHPQPLVSLNTDFSGEELHYHWQCISVDTDSLTGRLIKGKCVGATDDYDLYKWSMDVTNSYEVILAISHDEPNKTRIYSFPDYDCYHYTIPQED